MHPSFTLSLVKRFALLVPFLFKNSVKLKTGENKPEIFVLRISVLTRMHQMLEIELNALNANERHFVKDILYRNVKHLSKDII